LQSDDICVGNSAADTAWFPTEFLWTHEFID